MNDAQMNTGDKIDTNEQSALLAVAQEQMNEISEKITDAERFLLLMGFYSHQMIKAAQDIILFVLNNPNRPVKIELKDFPSHLRLIGASFITLNHNGQLRGCIGSTRAHRPLISDILYNSHAAAFKDHRFNRLSKEELNGLDISLSVLTPLEEMTFKNQDDLLNQLKPGVDGLLIQDKGMSAVYLPEVWEKINKPDAFLESLKIKGGFKKDHWSDSFLAWRYQTHKTTAIPFA